MKATILVFMITASTVFAIPQLINYQGELTRPDGTPLDTTVSMVFRLYASPSGGVASWTETHSGVVVTDGLFQVLLGSVTTLPDSFTINTRWLAVRIGSDLDMTPRRQIAAVPYAYRVGTVDGASGGNISGKINVGSGNSNAGSFASVFGSGNSASADYSIVTGGSTNFATGIRGAVLGGDLNVASGTSSSIAGGSSNRTYGLNSSLGGGKNNAARGNYSFVGGGGGSAAGDSNSAIGVNSVVMGGSRNAATDSFAVVGGGRYNVASGHAAVIAGGDGSPLQQGNEPFDTRQGNAATGDGAFIGGGGYNVAFGRMSVICGGGGTWDSVYSYGNTANGTLGVVVGGYLNYSGEEGVVVGGDNNIASVLCTVVGGQGNQTQVGASEGYYTTIVGGASNFALGLGSTICGGSHNYAGAGGASSSICGGDLNVISSYQSVVCGGRSNQANGQYSVVCGGGDMTFLGADMNSANGVGSVIAGGAGNYVLDSLTTVVGGRKNRARGKYSVVVGGGGPSLSDSNSAVGVQSVVTGGWNNAALCDRGTVCGGAFNRAGVTGGTDATVCGGAGNLALADKSVIGGGNNNRARGQYSFVGGGGGPSLSDSNATTGDYTTIAGGTRNKTTNTYATVVGGFSNLASNIASTISGGSSNTASGQDAFIGGGYHNTAGGYRSMIPGGAENEATSNYCFAAGSNAHALHSGAFVWSDGWGVNLSSTANDQFSARAAGGYRMFTNTAHDAGVTLAAGGNAWVGVSDSTKKRDIRLTDTRAVLDKLATLPVKDWEYKSEPAGVEHIGPMAQDFWNAFRLGSDSLGIATNDADGVLFAAVQELAKENDGLKKELALQATRYSELAAQVQKLMAQEQQSLNRR